MPVKTYVLLSSMDADAPVFQTTGDGQRIKVTKLPVFRPYLRVGFQTKEGKSKVIRYKEHCSSIFQDVQVKDDLIPANDPFTQNEYRALVFKFGSLTTNNEMAQKYLEAYPGMEGFDGFCNDVKVPVFKLLDLEMEGKIQNTETRKRVRAANKILDMSKEDLQSMIIRLNGSFIETPDDKMECENMMLSFIDDGTEAAVDAVLKDEKEFTVDESTTILLGKLINAEKLSFLAVPNAIVKKNKAGDWIQVKEVSDQLSLEEKKRLFSDFLNSNAGKLLKDDLEKDLSEENGDEANTAKRMGRPPKSN